ncbi:MAG: sugar kinase [Candidatus Methanoperedens sp.]|nr:sugar kinase [Candidatus Methanoperedens sp.]
MLVLIGTYPGKNPKIVEGSAGLTQRGLKVGDELIGISSGASGMAAACASACRALGIEPPYCILAGDTGNGEGSRKLYSYLEEKVFGLSPDIITLHYMAPLIDHMVDFGFALEESGMNPVLIADAGAMYGAKISGIGHIFDLFTPDKGELAFLADEDAAHPMFVNENLYDFPDNRIPELAEKVSCSGTSPGTLLVKGSIDYIVRGGKVINRVYEPAIPAMEAVGGTGDTLTGIVSALIHSGRRVDEACFLAAGINRMAGRLCDMRPDTQISALIDMIPDALRYVMGPVGKSLS